MGLTLARTSPEVPPKPFPGRTGGITRAGSVRLNSLQKGEAGDSRVLLSAIGSMLPG